MSAAEQPVATARATADHYPGAPVRANHVEPAPRRVRVVADGLTVVDTVRAMYVFEWPYYPQYYVPAADVRTDLLRLHDDTETTARGTARWCTLDTGHRSIDAAARWLVEARDPRLRDTVCFAWEAVDSWFEEDEEVFVHPRNPFTRVDALRSTRHVRIERDGVVLAESSAPVLVFETGLPTRYYVDRSAVDFAHLVPSRTRTACPYKGRTTAYWSARIEGRTLPDLAWCYDFPTKELLPIAGLVAFYDEQVDVVVDGVRLARPRTHFSPRDE